MDTLRISTPEESPLEASKWLDCQALLSLNEMRHLFTSLEPFSLFLAGSITPIGQGELSKHHFLDLYEKYVGELSRGNKPDISDYRAYFSAVMVADDGALYKILLEKERQLVRIAKPVVQMQMHHIDYSPVDGKFRSMVFGKDSMSWGIQFSFPQLFQDSISKEIVQTRQQASDPNMQLFKRLQKWMREHTVPTPFCVEDRVVNVPARIGKDCFPWINQHSQLINKKLSVKI